MKRPSPAHIQRVLQRERDLADWLFAPHRDDQERAQNAHALRRLIAASQNQPELHLEKAAA